MSEHTFSNVICWDDTRTVHHPLDRDINFSSVQGKSPIVQVKEAYSNLDMVTCRLSSCNLDQVYKVHLPIILASEGQAVYRERKLYLGSASIPGDL